jgi:hypothetical protein
MKPNPEKLRIESTESSLSDGNIVRKIDNQDIPEEKDMKKMIILVYIALVLLGVGTGFLLTRSISNGKTNSTGAVVENGKTVGSTDTTTFKDSATGTLQKGGLDGEGTHKLIRTGGDSQTVYLISSVVDLDKYVGKQVKVWGQTQAAQKAAWLMDVGKVEINE